MLKKSLVFVVPLFVLLASCGSIGGAGSVSLDDEWQLGNQLAAQVEQQVQLVRDPQALAYIRMVGERIHAVTPLANRPFDFEIINDSSVNAFSIPGGHVYINSGLIREADRVDELAAVMAHEISHVVARHALKQVEQQQEIATIAALLLGQNPNALAQIAAQILAGGAMARFSRADEKQADDMGLDFVTRAGYDPHGMLEFFQKLLAMDRGGSSSVSRFFRDHPGTQDRIDDISGRIQRMGRTGGIIDDPDYQVIRRRLM
jgi:beta-barrel assembly-enhancing protease